MVRTEFKSDEDHADGLYCLALQGRVRCLPDGLFELQEHMLEHLDREGIKYTIVTGETLCEADKVRNTPAVTL